MRITKKQLKRIVKEEAEKLARQSRLQEKRQVAEGRMAEREAVLIDEIVDLLIEAGAIRMPGTVAGDNAEPDYAEAIQYLKDAVIPTLESYVQPKFVDLTDPREL